MQVLGIDITQIAELGTQIANAGAIRTLEHVGDEMFEYLVGVAVLIYETGTAQ